MSEPTCGLSQDECETLRWSEREPGERRLVAARNLDKVILIDGEARISVLTLDEAIRLANDLLRCADSEVRA